MEYVGFEFNSQDGDMISLAEEMLQKTHKFIDKYKLLLESEVPKHAVLQYIKYLMLPSVSYPAFTDDGKTKGIYE